MDWIQALITVIIALVVSSIVFIIPYVIPRQLTGIILLFRKFQNSTDPSEISIYINQFLKYTDWKMLISKGILEQIFERKYNNFEEEEKKYWDELKDKVESVQIKDAIKGIQDELDELEQPIEKNGKIVYSGFHAVNLSRYLEYYQDKYKENKNTKVWHFKELSRDDVNKMLDIDDTPNPEQGFPAAVIMGKKMEFRAYTSEEAGKILHMKSIQLIETDGKWEQNNISDENNIPTSETFLMEVGLEKPIEITENGKYKIFNNILLNFNLEEEDNKKGLSVALSNMDESMKMFDTIINECSDITPLKTRFLNKLKNKEDNVVKE